MTARPCYAAKRAAKSGRIGSALTATDRTVVRAGTGTGAAIIVLALVIAAFVAAPAGASRRATPAETRAMAAATRSPRECFFAHVSTVNRSWAIGTDVALGSCQRTVGNGYVVMHRERGRWRDVLQASEGHDTFCDDYGIPFGVARDLAPVVPICVRRARL